MADVRTLPVVEDVGSEELRQLRLSYNALLDQLGTFMDAIEAATADASVNAAATAFLAAAETDTTSILKVGGEPGVPSRPRRAVTV